MSEHKAREAKTAARREKLLEEFDKDSNSVVLRSEIIFGAVVSGENSYGVQLGEYPTGLVKQVSFDLLFRSMMLFQHMEFQKAMKEKQEKRIVTAGV